MKSRVSSTPTINHDEGYSTSSQNGGTPNSTTVTFSKSNPELAKTESPKTLPKSSTPLGFHTLPHKQSHTLQSYSTDETTKESLHKYLYQRDTPSYSSHTLPRNFRDHQNLQREMVLKKPELAQIETISEKSEADKYNTLSRKEIKDLNALLTMFDEEKIECSSTSSDGETALRNIQSDLKAIERQISVTEQAKDSGKICILHKRQNNIISVITT